MKIVDEFTDADVQYWRDLDPQPAVFQVPQDMPNCDPAKAIITRSNFEADPEGVPVVRVAWQPDEVELAHLAKGGKIWLSTWGGLPPHMLEVAPPATDASPP